MLQALEQFVLRHRIAPQFEVFVQHALLPIVVADLILNVEPLVGKHPGSEGQPEAQILEMPLKACRRSSPWPPGNDLARLH
jgi:hypothetical protein